MILEKVKKLFLSLKDPVEFIANLFTILSSLNPISTTALLSLLGAFVYSNVDVIEFRVDFSLQRIIIICLLLIHMQHVRQLILDSREKDVVHFYDFKLMYLAIHQPFRLLAPVTVLFFGLYINLRADTSFGNPGFLSCVGAVLYFLLIESQTIYDRKKSQSSQLLEWDADMTLKHKWAHRIRVKLNADGVVHTKSFPEIGLKGSPLHRQTNWAIDRYFEQNEIDESLSLIKERRKIFFINLVLKKDTNK